MANRYWTQADLRAELLKRMEGRTQVEVAAEIGIPPQNLSLTIKGAPIYGQIVTWLGYEKADPLYRKVQA